MTQEALIARQLRNPDAKIDGKNLWVKEDPNIRYIVEPTFSAYAFSIGSDTYEWNFRDFPEPTQDMPDKFIKGSKSTDSSYSPIIIATIVVVIIVVVIFIYNKFKKQ